MIGINVKDIMCFKATNLTLIISIHYITFKSFVLHNNLQVNIDRLNNFD